MLKVLMHLVGAAALGVAGWQIGEGISTKFLPWGLALTLGGVILGAVAVPYIVFKPLGKALDSVNQLPATTLLAGTIGLVVGLVVGLVIAALVSIPIFKLEGWHSWGIPLIISFSLGSLGLWLGVNREFEMRRMLPGDVATAMGSSSSNGRILVDTSAIIDGRIADLGLTGFIQGTLVIPGFVLDELRHIADSSDSMRRTRGRRGLEVLGKLRRETAVPIQVLDVDLHNGTEVDAQLVKAGQEYEGPHTYHRFQPEPGGGTPGHTSAQR